MSIRAVPACSFECVYGTIESSISILGFYIHHLDLLLGVSLHTIWLWQHAVSLGCSKLIEEQNRRSCRKVRQPFSLFEPGKENRAEIRYVRPTYECIWINRLMMSSTWTMLATTGFFSSGPALRRGESLPPPLSTNNNNQYHRRSLQQQTGIEACSDCIYANGHECQNTHRLRSVVKRGWMITPKRIKSNK
jgi:hypothetical protein